ncbi:hypothetical protein KC19_2G103700 [Ceratodon purpureus]|uniref:DUF7748 domain-containing protein n=1 Tax=Ceratodon purpureus TaxID=3225 RepID=A0A8T0IUX2_CERPU|nr:hypothetical protein KC19_2G103700 [Ceratodon purpureus]
MKTKFVNGTSSELTLKEANSGIHRLLFKLRKKDQFRSSFDMKLDNNATYREYHLFVIPSSSASTIVVSSDHLVDNKVITIMEVEPGVFSWEGTPRKPEVTKAKQEEGGRSHEDQATSTKFLTQWSLSKWILQAMKKDHDST